MKRFGFTIALLICCLQTAYADTKISALPDAAALAGTEPIPAVQTGATVKTTPAALNTYVKANAPCTTLQVMFNSAGAYGCDADLTWNPTTNTLVIGSVATAGILRTPDGSASNGGGLTIRTGAGVGTNRTGGALSFVTGAPTGTGAYGPFNITVGTDVFTMIGDGNLELDVNAASLTGLTLFNANNSAVAETGAQVAALSAAGIMELGITNNAFTGASGNWANVTAPFAWVGTFSAYPMVFGSGNGDPAGFVQHNNLVPSKFVAHATTDTDAFLYVPKVAGVPTGVPAHLTGNYAFALPLTFDSTNSKVCVYNGGWQCAGTDLSGTSASLGGGALSAGACASNTTSVTGAATTMAAVATPNTYPGDGAVWSAQVTSANTVTTRVCAIVALTPTASTYNIRVLR